MLTFAPGAVLTRPVAVFLGSSNAEPRTGWVADFAARNGWVGKNFAVGGGGFNQPGPLAFMAQAVAAVGDTSIRKSDVRFVFIVDCSNDTRGKSSIGSPAREVLDLLVGAYPNARVVIVPEVLPLTAANAGPEILWWVTRHYNELRNIAQSYRRVEVVNNSWLWFWDTGAWSALEPIDVHLNPAGYARLAWFLEQYVNCSAEHANDLGDNTGNTAAPGEVHARRVGGVVSVHGVFTLTADQNTAVVIARVHRCFAHNKGPVPVFAWRQSDGAVRVLEFAVDGALNIQVPVPAGVWRFAISFAQF